MEEKNIVEILSALAQETRLQIFRRLMQAGPCGLAAGRIAAELGVPGATLSFHLKEMKHAGIVYCRKNGRSLIYSANFESVSAVLAYLMKDCCQPESCTDGKPKATERKVLES